jgi:hypothetical protein
VLDHAAAQVRLELLDDEVRQTAGLLGSLEEGRPPTLDLCPWVARSAEESSK